MVNIVNIPGVALEEALSKKKSASEKKFQVFGVTLESDNENIVPSDEPDKMLNAYFLAKQGEFQCSVCSCFEYLSSSSRRNNVGFSPEKN